MYDVIVLGTGGVGSAAMLACAKRGAKVLGLDRFPAGHDRGSSHGESRVIRRSYFEHADYVPLLNLAYGLWDELEQRCGEQFLHRTGVVYFGPQDGVILRGVLKSAENHQLVVERLNAHESMGRFPGYVVPPKAGVLFEADAGYLDVEKCICAQIQEATTMGAEHRHGETVMRWSADENSVVVETDGNRYRAARLVITAGCWAAGLLQELNVPLRIVRKHLHWHASDKDTYRESHGGPCFFYEANGGHFYGFPDAGRFGVKVAEHSGGTEITDPLSDLREEEADDTQRIEQFLKQYLPGVSMNRTRHEVCFYTMTPDEHFVVDHHPEHKTVCFAAGLSGHGFKFTSSLGQILTELALDERSSVDVDFLRLNRPGLY
ncbi:MAG: N-methyl-L-tryptophan oxidase [Fuerstiella sp.]|nr:N-methyl-L-tryptophan oxidase [Fuerstiella sp.]MCP4512040.1 N-methyl-L-tryptophan oxidase [Fuerstiella sp.]